jgi:transcriptional regulator with XRE-family HTH domain
MKAAALKAIRKRLGLTQERLAIHLGVDLQSVKFWETDRSPITQRTELQLQSLEREFNLQRRQTPIVDLTKSRAHVLYLNGGPTVAEAKKLDKIEEVLAARFHEDTMVGHVDIALSREPEGWRVTSAWLVSSLGVGPKKYDWRPQVIEALREASIALAH